MNQPKTTPSIWAPMVTNEVAVQASTKSRYQNTDRGYPARVIVFSNLDNQNIPTTKFLHLNVFYGRSRNTIGAVEEVGVVGRSTGHKQQILFRAFQRRDRRLRIVRQVLQLRVV